MAQGTLIKQTLTVKKIIKAADSRYGKASIIVPLNGKDEFLGLNDGVDENAFVDGGTYDLELSVSKTGKRYVNKVVGTATEEVVAKAPKAKAGKVSHTAGAEVVAGLDRDQRITLMNVGNIAGNLSAGDAGTFAANFAIVKEVYKAEGII